MAIHRNTVHTEYIFYNRSDISQSKYLCRFQFQPKRYDSRQVDEIDRNNHTSIRVYAYCWQQPTTGQPNKWGHDVNLTPGGIETKGAEKVSFVFPARDFPYGPTNIRIYASNNEGKKDVFELQLYN